MQTSSKWKSKFPNSSCIQDSHSGFSAGCTQSGRGGRGAGGNHSPCTCTASATGGRTTTLDHNKNSNTSIKPTLQPKIRHTASAAPWAPRTCHTIIKQMKKMNMKLIMPHPQSHGRGWSDMAPHSISPNGHMAERLHYKHTAKTNKKHQCLNKP